MRRFYVTFGASSIFRGYHAEFEAKDESIVRAYMNKRVKCPWSNIYKVLPSGSMPLQKTAEVLFYSSAAHIA